MPLPLLLKRQLLLQMLLIFSALFPALGQTAGNGTISGSITDATTKEPLGFATVFIAQTTYGTNAAEDGTFQLTGIPAGSHEVVVSFLGYENLTYTFTLAPGQNQRLKIALTPKENKLEEVVVRHDPDWLGNYQVFFRQFVGQSKNAAHSTILNTDVLKFYFNTKENKLTADASQPLVIENKALGYRIHFLLEVFTMDFKNKQVLSAGYPRYEPLKPKSKAQQKRWDAARLQAYNGSMMHFVRALQAQTLEQEGFNVRRLERRPNPNRPPEEQIQAGLARWRGKNKNTIVIGNGASPEDSLQYWYRMSRLDRTVTYLYKDPIPYHQLVQPDSATRLLRLQFKDFLNVVYTREKEEMGYVNQGFLSPRRQPGYQTSVISLTSDFALIEPSGLIHDPYSHVVEEYWGWEKLAETLPLDYHPTAPKNK